MIEMRATVRNRAGIHCRPSALIVQSVREYAGSVHVRHGRDACDLHSVVDLLAMGLGPDDTLQVQVEGPDEACVCADLVELFERRFDFPPRDASCGRGDGVEARHQTRDLAL
jgi:phosphocarrier protein